MSAPKTPGIQAKTVRIRTIKKEPQPLSITANGGQIIDNNTLKKLIILFYLQIYVNSLFNYMSHDVRHCYAFQRKCCNSFLKFIHLTVSLPAIENRFLCSYQNKKLYVEKSLRNYAN